MTTTESKFDTRRNDLGRKAFALPSSAFVSQVNRATSETLRLQTTQEGLVPLKAWIKSALDYVIQIHLGEPDLEFVWVGDDAVDPLQQAQTLNILVGAGIKTIVEARADLGLAPEGKAAPALGKFNPYHDERGRFTTAEGAVDPGEPPPKELPDGIHVASSAPTAPIASTQPDWSGTNISLVSAADRAACIARCSDLALPTNDFGIQFRRCILARESGGNSGFPEWDRHFR